MPTRSSIKRPRDANQLAKLIVDIASGGGDTWRTDEGKNPAAVALGRMGGLKGGVARAEKLTSDERKQIASFAAQTRWKKEKGKNEYD
jgi:hypothetical protein